MKRALRRSITADELRAALTYDPLTGVFVRLVSSGNVRAGSIAGSPNGDGYLQIMVQRCQYMAHRLAWLYMTGAWPEGEVDHRDGARANNRWANLRDVTINVNQQNRRCARAGSAAGLLGVVARKNGTFSAIITVDRKCVRLGVYGTAQEAHSVYLDAKRRMHVGCTI